MLKQRCLGCRAVEGHRAAVEIVGIEVAERKVRVRHRGALAAGPVAGGAGVRSGALRPDADCAVRCLCDGTAARADLHQLDRRHVDRQARAFLVFDRIDLESRRDNRLAAIYGSELRCRAAHVEAEHAVGAQLLSDLACEQHACGRPALDDPNRVFACQRWRYQPTVGLHDREFSIRAESCKIFGEASYIGTDQRLYEAVGNRCVGALVFAQFGRDVHRETERRSRQPPGQRRRNRSLMRRVSIGMEQRNRDCLITARRNLLDNGFEVFGVQRLQHVALETHPLPHLEDLFAGNQRVRLLHVQVVGLVPLLPAEDEHVAKAASGNQRRLGAAPLDDGVGRDRSSVKEVSDFGPAGARLFQQRRKAVPDRLGRVGRCRRGLVHRNPAGFLVAKDEVGECAADIDADPVSRCDARHGFLISPAGSAQPMRAVMPPSTGRLTPVMNRASSEARNSAAWAVSQPVPIFRFSGIWASRDARTSSAETPLLRTR